MKKFAAIRRAKMFVGTSVAIVKYPEIIPYRSRLYARKCTHSFMWETESIYGDSYNVQTIYDVNHRIPSDTSVVGTPPKYILSYNVR